MNAKLSNLSELANILSVKSEIRANTLALFARFGIGLLLCHMSFENPIISKFFSNFFQFIFRPFSCLFSKMFVSLFSEDKSGVRQERALASSEFSEGSMRSCPSSLSACLFFNFFILLLPIQCQCTISMLPYSVINTR